jgi:hypothetical protein
MAVIDNLVAYYSLDEASGNAIDAHGANDLTDNNTVGAAAGLVSGARDFESGNNEHFNLADNADLSLGADTSFSWALWFKAEQDPTASGRTLLSKSSGEDSGCEYSLWFDTGSSGQKISFRVGNGSSSAQALSESPYGVVDNTNWHFIVVWHDAAADTLNVQIDNRSPVATAWSGGTQNGATEFQLGHYSAWGARWDGLLDEVGFWKKALTSDERTWLYNSGAGRSYADIVAEAGGGGGLAIPIIVHHLRQQGIA